MNILNRLQIAMRSGNGFSIVVSQGEEEVVAELANAAKESRWISFKSGDGSDTVVTVLPSEVEGYMLMPLPPESGLALPRRPH